MDQVRVLRIIEYIGPREAMDKQINQSLHGEKSYGNGVTIRAVMMGGYPEVLRPRRDDSFDSAFPPNLALTAAEWGKRGA